MSKILGFRATIEIEFDNMIDEDTLKELYDDKPELWLKEAIENEGLVGIYTKVGEIKTCETYEQN